MTPKKRESLGSPASFDLWESLNPLISSSRQDHQGQLPFSRKVCELMCKTSIVGVWQERQTSSSGAAETTQSRVVKHEAIDLYLLLALQPTSDIAVPH